VADLTHRLGITQQKLTLAEAQGATLAKRLAGLERKFTRSNPNVAALARNALRSVYTVESGQELGTAWVAWRNASGTYLITANHVVSGAVANGDTQVTLRRKSASYTGTVVRSDETNDLALIRADASVPGPPLWEEPRLDVAPVVGDQLILVGSPYGLEGTVTQGVVSRITYDAIQTDAAANPGNSGGPAIDRDGQVVGVLLAGGGENLNFAAPIQRACVTLRSC
jgi:serine protease Do